MSAPTHPLDRFVDQKTILLTTFRRDGTPVGSPVSIVVEDHRAYIRTWEAAAKYKRMLNNPEVQVAPSTFRGRPTGPALRARARVLTGADAQHARQLLARKYPFLHGFLVPLIHRLQGNETAHLELTDLDDRPEASSAVGAEGRAWSSSSPR